MGRGRHNEAFGHCQRALDKRVGLYLKHNVGMGNCQSRYHGGPPGGALGKRAGTAIRIRRVPPQHGQTRRLRPVSASIRSCQFSAKEISGPSGGSGPPSKAMAMGSKVWTWVDARRP